MLTRVHTWGRAQLPIQLPSEPVGKRDWSPALVTPGCHPRKALGMQDRVGGGLGLFLLALPLESEGEGIIRGGGQAQGLGFLEAA